jgi:UDP:flavonoid glycosyltransferase YjiC (YdhE family)
VLVTFGTVFSTPAALSPLLKELSQTDLDVVATTGLVAKPDDFDVDPHKVTLVDFTPLAELLRDVDLVISHGGAGSTLGTLAAGIPMVVIPQGADQPVQAGRVEAAGAGIALRKEEADPVAVANAAVTILRQSSYRDAACKIAQQIAALPSPEEVASQLAAALQ